MTGKMNQELFDENRGAAADEVQTCMRLAEEAHGLICQLCASRSDLATSCA